MLRAIFTSCLAILLLVFPMTAQADEKSAARYFEAVKTNPVALRAFLFKMPKGADLHSHLLGAVYAEDLIGWAAKDGHCVDMQVMAIVPAPCDAAAGKPAVASIGHDQAIINPLIDSLSVRNYERRAISGHDQFFAAFDKAIVAFLGREADAQASVIRRAARQNIGYLELMDALGMFEIIALAADPKKLDTNRPAAQLFNDPQLTKIARQAIALQDKIEQKRRQILGCNRNPKQRDCMVQVRYLAQVLRAVPRPQVRAQTILAAKLMALDPRFVGLNFVMPEDHPLTLANHAWQMEQIREAMALLPKERRNVALHAGELALGLVPPRYLGRHIRQAVEVAGARRIGHGVDIGHDPDYQKLMADMRKRGIAVEINLTSNDVILGISGAAHPFATYLENRVPLVLSTDDEGVSRIDLTHEYQRAVETYNLSYRDIKIMARNAVEHSFLSSTDKAALLEDLKRRFSEFEGGYK